ncbi:Uncharacterized conserved protein YbdZ, MbtH family [Actinacidiphila yanglinensis]|uniref:Uncharacterized conserved protein YbdZ, MbtH family n=1 Tax=Actinacidiphila yanglinensis TaxID=310779 RepID=A0A1H6DGJ5_9ACTN|nr:Uncharacterized conserved protein YbdZ, MbtH family [Actinacidiphila yanglinensis]
MDADAQEYRVVVNAEEQYSIWPADQELPGGWDAVGVSGGKQHCLDHIAEVWTDMRPLSVRRRIAEQAAAAGNSVPAADEPQEEAQDEPPSLVSRLSAREHPVEVRLRDGEDLAVTAARGQIRLYFPTTQGGTELTVPVDPAASDLTAARSGADSGTVRFVGEFVLDYERVRCEATVELTSLTGYGRLRPVPDRAAHA